MTQIRQNNKDAYGLILDAIDIGVYKPGDRLVESELADRFGVSRTPIREALQRLETQSLLSREPSLRPSAGQHPRSPPSPCRSALSGYYVHFAGSR